MGVKNLWDILESCKKTLPLHHLQNRRLCVDLSCWLIQFQNAGRLPACSKEKIYLRNLFHRLRALISLNCSLILVTGFAPNILSNVCNFIMYVKSILVGALIEQMPVPCPVSAIVKLRKVQGQDYYEVSWQGIDGLGNSIVPADLIKSACPERIAEYMEKKAEVKQQNRRPRRSSKALVNQIDLQLQGLLLGIESQSKTLPETANRLPPPSAAPEVIDLCSPSPPLRTCRVAKCQKSIDMHVNVIDIHESDGDATPEHERKARELRLFIDSIREDLY
ncbi:RmlD substrate binding domain [Musa troglodytarum]|uniref:RmlD substrate binding domain n=1 Tax=Musa troglodytarum TaxID=320322 RepID=A0A9E7KJ95_9LILI|nr:RmlD substrate binding domain [Musa troglodytarum]